MLGITTVIVTALFTRTDGGWVDKCGWMCPDPCIDKTWICDGYDQCPDDSDEGKEPGEGCNLFPESGCPSFQGLRHYKCNRTGDCFENEDDAKECEQSIEAPKRECTGGLWKCRDGRCIERDKVCDGTEHCEDGSDESRLDFDGCNSFPNDTNACTSWGGQRYIPCPASKDILICITSDIEITADDPNSCRTCHDQDSWRCNNGLCINETLHRNGSPDCIDGSDELQLDLRWYIIIIITVVVVLTGIGISFTCRALNRRNTKRFFHCQLCSASTRKKVERYNSVASSDRGDNTDCVNANSTEEDALLYQSEDIPFELISLFDDKFSNWEKRKREGVAAKIHGSTYSPSTLKTSVILKAKRLYVMMHNKPMQFHHLYMYFANRSATTKELSKVTKYLYAWEKEIHHLDELEVIKCWRLHLGSSSLTGMIINSATKDRNIESYCTTAFYPLRKFIRSFRRRYLQVKPKEDSDFYYYSTIAYSTIIPFLEASFFYIEKIKNIIYVHIILTALTELSHDKVMDHPFELSLIISMSLGISLTQLVYLIYSIYFAEDIFEVGHEKHCEQSRRRNIFLKVLAALLFPLMPCYVLANHIYYDSKLTMARRHLQMHNDSADAVEEGDEESSQRINQNDKIELYKNIYKLQDKSLLYRKFYSYFRVTSAILESATMVVVLVLLLKVTNRPNRSIRLMLGVEHSLYNFFDIPPGSSLLSELNLMRDVVMLGSIIYSMLVIVTALLKYWYQAKHLAISFSGQVALGLYLCFLTLNRLTTSVSLFATTQPLRFDDGAKEPIITLPIANILFVVILTLRFGLVYFYKSNYVYRWKEGCAVDKWVNILINTLVVVPFMVQVNPIQALKEKEKRISSSPQKNKEKNESCKRRRSFLHPFLKDDQDQNQIFENIGNFIKPNFHLFSPQDMYDEFRGAIRKLWWKDTRRKLDVETIKKKMQEDNGMKRMLEKMKKEDIDRNIEITLEHLECIGMVNTPLLNPSQTKREYFWLFIFVILENIIALIIELVNGGVWTSQGHYYSWDIRLGTLTLSLIFLATYYKRYHITKDLNNTSSCGGWIRDLPVWCFYSDEPGITAPPDENAMEEILSPGTSLSQIMSIEESDTGRKKLVTVHTQTDFGPYSKFPLQDGNAPSSPNPGPTVPNNQRLSPNKKGHRYNTRYSTYSGNHGIDNNAIDTVDGSEISSNGGLEMNGFPKRNLTLIDKDYTLFKSTIIGRRLWDSNKNSDTSHNNSNDYSH